MRDAGVKRKPLHSLIRCCNIRVNVLLLTIGQTKMEKEAKARIKIHEMSGCGSESKELRGQESFNTIL